MPEIKSILDKEIHARLIADMAHVCKVANIPEQFVHTSMVGIAAPAEIEWVKGFHAHRASGTGLAMVGVDEVDTRMMAICGALLRNFIDARIVPVNSLILQTKKGNAPEPTVLLIPNLFIGDGKGIAQWDVQVLYELLLSRLTANKLTVMYVEDMDALKKAYGTVFASHIKSHYQIIEG